jgi:diguanylate cyclase (GGDEF)-like protein
MVVRDSWVRGVLSCVWARGRGARSRRASDPLTGVANAFVFQAAVENEHSSVLSLGREALVLVVDLDGLKVFNDRLGHAAGDAILRDVAERLRRCVGERGLVARIGGDEFAILIRAPADDGTVLAAEFRRAISLEPVVVGGQRCSIEASIGWALLNGVEDPAGVLRRADEQMYLAKRRAGSDPFDRVSELVVGLLDAGDDGVEEALASGVAEVARAEIAYLCHAAGEQWWSAPPEREVRDRLRVLAQAAERADEVLEQGGWELGVPLRGDGAPIGGFAVSRGYPFDKPDRIALARCGVAIGQALLRLRENQATRRRISTLEDLAFRDENTGLANRRALLAALEQNAATEPLSVLFLDFDGLRQVNNELSYGHGNELLRRVARAIERTLSPHELAARLHGSGGDEFIVVCPYIDETEAATRTSELEEALMRVELPPEIAALYGGASAGHALRRPGETPLNLLERAATLMRFRKQQRKSATAST